MTTSTSIRRNVSSLRRHEGRRHANPWKTRASARQATPGRSRTRDDTEVILAGNHASTGRVELPRKEMESSASPGGAAGLVTFLVLAVAVVSGVLYGADHFFSEFARHSTMDVFRMFGGIL